MSAVSQQTSDFLQQDVTLQGSTLNITGPLLDIYKSEPHSHYAAGAQGMTNISVGDLQIAAPSQVSLSVRKPWDADLKTPERSHRSDETQMDTSEYLRLMNPD
jgi:hypothetical protein